MRTQGRHQVLVYRQRCERELYARITSGPRRPMYDTHAGDITGGLIRGDPAWHFEHDASRASESDEAYYYACAPLWSVSLAFAIFPAAWCITVGRAAVRRAAVLRGRCPCCGYDLRATPRPLPRVRRGFASRTPSRRITRGCSGQPWAEATR